MPGPSLSGATLPTTVALSRQVSSSPAYCSACHSAISSRWTGTASGLIASLLMSSNSSAIESSGLLSLIHVR